MPPARVQQVPQRCSCPHTRRESSQGRHRKVDREGRRRIINIDDVSGLTGELESWAMERTSLSAALPSTIRLARRKVSPCAESAHQIRQAVVGVRPATDHASNSNGS